MTENNFKEELGEEWAQLEENPMLSPGFVKKKLIAWVIRTALAVALYVYFWDNEWVRWSLWGYVPLNLFALASAVLWPYVIRRKMEKVKEKL